jgi:hypothetical protein
MIVDLSSESRFIHISLDLQTLDFGPSTFR